MNCNAGAQLINHKLILQYRDLRIEPRLTIWNVLCSILGRELVNSAVWTKPEGEQKVRVELEGNVGVVANSD